MPKLPKYPKGLKARIKRLEKKAARAKAIDDRKKEIEALRKKEQQLKSKIR